MSFASLWHGIRQLSTVWFDKSYRQVLFVSINGTVKGEREVL